MVPNIWGPPAWLFLHSITFNYPKNPSENDKNNYNTFFNSLKYVIPCPICKEHYAKNLLKLPIRLNTRDDLIRWLIDIHNSVNKSNNKPVLSYQEVYDKYDKLYNQTDDFFNDNKLKICIALAIILIIGFYVYKIEKN